MASMDVDPMHEWLCDSAVKRAVTVLLTCDYLSGLTTTCLY